MKPDPARRRAEYSISSSVGREEDVSGTGCLLKTPGKVWLPSQHIFMAGHAGSLSTFLLTALKHKYSQLYFPETPPLQSGLLLSEEQAVQKIRSEII